MIPSNGDGNVEFTKVIGFIKKNIVLLLSILSIVAAAAALVSMLSGCCAVVKMPWCHEPGESPVPTATPTPRPTATRQATSAPEPWLGATWTPTRVPTLGPPPTVTPTHRPLPTSTESDAVSEGYAVLRVSWDAAESYADAVEKNKGFGWGIFDGSGRVAAMWYQRYFGRRNNGGGWEECNEGQYGEEFPAADWTWCPTWRLEAGVYPGGGRPYCVNETQICDAGYLPSSGWSYFGIYWNGQRITVARLKDDLSGVAVDPRRSSPENQVDDVQTVVSEVPLAFSRLCPNQGRPAPEWGWQADGVSVEIVEWRPIANARPLWACLPTVVPPPPTPAPTRTPVPEGRTSGHVQVRISGLGDWRYDPNMNNVVLFSLDTVGFGAAAWVRLADFTSSPHAQAKAINGEEWAPGRMSEMLMRLSDGIYTAQWFPGGFRLAGNGTEVWWELPWPISVSEVNVAPEWGARRPGVPAGVSVEIVGGDR